MKRTLMTVSDYKCVFALGYIREYEYVVGNRNNHAACRGTIVSTH